MERETQDHLGQRVTYQVPISAYPTNSGVIIVNSPGSGEVKDGRRARWAKLAGHLQEREIGTMVNSNATRPDVQVQLPWEHHSYKGASWIALLVARPAHSVGSPLAVPLREVEHATAAGEQDDGGRIAAAGAEQDGGDGDAVPGRDGDNLLIRAPGAGEQGHEQKKSEFPRHGGTLRLSPVDWQVYTA